MAVQATVEIILHATESTAKFYQAIENIFGFGHDVVQETKTEGHYGNEITMLRVVAEKRDAERIINAVSASLGESGIFDIFEEFDSRLSESGLHLRLDKQEFVQGRIAVWDGGTVKVRIYTPVYVKKDARDKYLSLFSPS